MTAPVVGRVAEPKQQRYGMENMYVNTRNRNKQQNNNKPQTNKNTNTAPAHGANQKTCFAVSAGRSGVATDLFEPGRFEKLVATLVRPGLTAKHCAGHRANQNTYFAMSTGRDSAAIDIFEPGRFQKHWLQHWFTTCSQQNIVRVTARTKNIVLL